MKNNNFYSLLDFVATIKRLPIDRNQLVSVKSSWGNSNGGSKAESGTELNFGAIVKIKSGWLYIRGSNDYTGWGCQDDASMFYSSSEITKKRALLFDKTIYDGFELFEEIIWDKNPVDLNKWIRKEISIDEEYL